MKRALVVLVAFQFAYPSFAAAGPILESAERAIESALEAEENGGLLQTSGARRRSLGRTIGGGILIGIGVPMFLAGMLASEDFGGTTCVNGDCITVSVDTGGLGKGVAGLGGGMTVVGALLVSVWSDVPAVNSLDLQVTPTRIQVGKSFGF